MLKIRKKYVAEAIAVIDLRTTNKRRKKRNQNGPNLIQLVFVVLSFLSVSSLFFQSCFFFSFTCHHLL